MIACGPDRGWTFYLEGEAWLDLYPGESGRASELIEWMRSIGPRSEFRNHLSFRGQAPGGVRITIERFPRSVEKRVAYAKHLLAALESGFPSLRGSCGSIEREPRNPWG